ncbi:MAG: hypothetical protein JO247_23690 [Chloroflexi bacterium]|nr:hypothetical protein [Chloroflexota bacterium]
MRSALARIVALPLVSLVLAGVGLSPSGADAAAAPAPPTNLTAVRQLNGKVLLTWTDPATTSNVTGYKVHRYATPANQTPFWFKLSPVPFTDSNGVQQPAQLDSNPETNPTATSVSDTNIAQFVGRPHYNVCAYNSAGLACSNVAQAGAPPPPASPTATSAANGDVTLSWTDAANGLAQYVVARFNPTLTAPCSEVIKGGSTVSCNFQTAQLSASNALAAGSTTFTDSSAAVESGGFLYGKWANYGICAVNFVTTSAGAQLNQANCAWGVTAKTPEPPVLSSAVTNVTVGANNGNVALTWTNPSSFGVLNVFRYDQVNKAWPGTALNANPLTTGTTTFSDTSAPLGFQTYKVCASNARGVRCSVPMGASRPANPPASAQVKTNADGSMNVSWSDGNNGTADYVVGRWDPQLVQADVLPNGATPKAFTLTNIGQVTGAILAPNTTSYTDNSNGYGGAGSISTQTGVVDHRVCAYNARGLNCVFGIPAPPPLPPGAPSGVQSGTSANISWTASASSDVANYLVVKWNGTAWAQLASVPGSTSPLTYADTNLSSGRYYYHVCASNARGKRCNQKVALVVVSLS